MVVPSMGDSITEGSIAAVLKATNDPVEEDEAIAQIETDKVSFECAVGLQDVAGGAYKSVATLGRGCCRPSCAEEVRLP